jgi:hypothetical protein
MPVNGTTRTPGRSGSARNGTTYRASTPKQDQARRERAKQRKVSYNSTKNRHTDKSKEYHFHVHKGDGGSGGSGGGQEGWNRQSPIGDADFLSAGHIRAFAERGRRSMRAASVDFAYAAETLKQVLREVPPVSGQGRSGAYMRANRVARQFKRAANAAQAASAHSARTWPAFLREYAPELNAYGGPRPAPRKQMNFGA